MWMMNLHCINIVILTIINRVQHGWGVSVIVTIVIRVRHGGGGGGVEGKIESKTRRARKQGS